MARSQKHGLGDENHEIPAIIGSKCVCVKSESLKSQINVTQNLHSPSTLVTYTRQGSEILHSPFSSVFIVYPIV